MKKEHDQALVDAKEEGYSEAIYEATDEVTSLKNIIYKAGYEYGLACAGLQDDHELYDKVVLAPPRLFVPAAPSASVEEDAELEEEKSDVPPPPPEG